VELAGKSVVVTGGAQGIGRALAEKFAAAGARGVVVADLDGEGARRVADDIAGVAVTCNVGDPEQIAELVRTAEQAYGPIDIFCSNAGYSDAVDLAQPLANWRNIVDVNLMAHVWAAQLVVPGMAERGEGYMMHTVSSAALITGPCGPGYALTKHGALGFAEWLTLNYGHRGVRVTCLCPNAVYTGMFNRPIEDRASRPPQDTPIGEILMPEDVADEVLRTMAGNESFLVLPHARVRESFLRKATDYDAWVDRTRQRLIRMGSVPAT
jgi:NAD(P)-dependent dehydrogenase (short-subunit alcohol dehydrogenase family)